MLEGQVILAAWPTLSASLPNDAEDPAEWLARAAALKAKHSNGNGAGMPLAVAKASERFPNLETVIAQTEAESAIGLALNPAWVESLMGFPAGWTSPLTDGPSAPAKRNPPKSRRASRKTARSDGND